MIDEVEKFLRQQDEKTLLGVLFVSSSQGLDRGSSYRTPMVRPSIAAKARRPKLSIRPGVRAERREQTIHNRWFLKGAVLIRPNRSTVKHHREQRDAREALPHPIHNRNQ
ncbi:MAG: hypothetical protein Ct9H300mP26_5260 [Acidimicrobiales bacterium]|nr:MAG: hypothetical protein Ct9H300mP26_5260 [Acidimicrobiales bacterium]